MLANASCPPVASVQIVLVDAAEDARHLEFGSRCSSVLREWVAAGVEIDGSCEVVVEVAPLERMISEKFGVARPGSARQPAVTNRIARFGHHSSASCTICDFCDISMH